MSSVPLTPGGNKTFKSNTAKAQAVEKTENIKDNLEANILRSTNVNQPNQAKIDEVKNAGKNFLSRYFKGFTSVERANIKADLDDKIVYRIVKHYQSAIRNFAEYKNFSNLDTYYYNLDLRFFGAVSLGLALKLQSSATDTEKKTNRVLSCLNSSIILPKKCGILLDQVGKTDIPGENYFRIRNQNFAAKRHLVKAIFNLITFEELKKHLIGETTVVQEKWNDLREIMNDVGIFTNMVDDTPWSVSRLHEIGRKIYGESSQINFQFWVQQKPDTKFSLRLPKVDFKKLQIKEVGNIISNGLFAKFDFDKEKLGIMAAGLILGVAKVHWLKRPREKMSKLESVLTGTWYADFTFIEILKKVRVWNLGYYFNDITLNTLGNIAIQRWNTSYSVPFQLFLNMSPIPFTDHGTDSQLVQVDKSKTSSIEGIGGYKTYSFETRTIARSVIKPTENGAILGTMLGYSDNIEFKSDWNVEFNSTNKQVLYEFLKNDFKENY